MSLPRRGVTALSLTIVVVLLGGMLSAYAAGTGTVDPPPRTAFLARADNPADALAAGPVAGRLGAPLFTTPSDVLDVHAREGLVAYDPELVILTGGPAALGAGVEDAVRAALPQATVRRVFGAGRTETARRLAETIDEYNPGFLPVDATALEAVDAQNAANAATLQGKAAADFLAADGTALTAIDAESAEDAAALQGKTPADFLAVDGTAVDADRLDGLDASAFLRDVILSDAGAFPMASGSTQCITAPYTPADDRIAVAQIGLSGARSTAGTGTFYARFLLSVDDGATWSTASNRIGPEDQVSDTQQGSSTYSDVVALTAGTTYRFAVRPLGSNLASGRCNMVITTSLGTAEQVID